MKYQICFVLSILAICATAQEFSLGLKAGWNYSQLQDLPDPGNDFDFEQASDFHLGGYLNIGLSEKWSFQPEVLYSGKGGQISFQDTSRSVTTDINLNYLTFPLLLQYRSGFLSIHAGPELGFQLDRNGSDERLGILDAETYDMPFDLSGVAGLTVHIGAISITGRYGRAFTKLVELEKTDINGNSTGKGTYGYNEFWQLSLGLRLL